MIVMHVLSSIIMIAIMMHISFKIIRREELHWADLSCIVLMSLYLILIEVEKLMEVLK